VTAPPVVEPAAAYYSAQAATATQAAVAASAAWQALDLAIIDETWPAVRDAILTAIVAGQVRAAVVSQTYLTAILDAAGLAPDPVAVIPPTGFAGRSAAGTSLTGAVDVAPVVVKRAIAAGRPVEEAAALGADRIDRIAKTETVDAGRGAMEAAIRLEPQVVGWERYVNMPACGRCILLAGRVYRKSEAFLRHPRCDCAHRPVTDRAARDETEQEPSSLFRELTREQQDRIFTADGARAIRAGADIGQVVNARRGMSAVGDPFTTAGAGRRRKGQTRASRLSPQGCALKAGADEALYLELLRANRYIT
jgi:hypothetical protein